MKNSPKIIIGIIVYNEQGKMTGLLKNLTSLRLKFPHQIVFLNDGSTDGSDRFIAKYLEKNPQIKAKIISNKQNSGIGYSIRKIIAYGKKNHFDICVVLAGNGKDNPLEIPRVIDPLINGGYDYVQGSRFLKGGSFKNLPLPRRLMVQGFALAFFLFAGRLLTDTSNGFRAYKLAIFKNKKINLNQNWLDRYELETYLHYKVITLGYKITEVAVSKNYLANIKSYSKIRPFIDWWKMFRPLILLRLGLKN